MASIFRSRDGLDRHPSLKGGRSSTQKHQPEALEKRPVANVLDHSECSSLKFVLSERFLLLVSLPAAKPTPPIFDHVEENESILLTVVRNRQCRPPNV
jgi:hypothetical protein